MNVPTPTARWITVFLLAAPAFAQVTPTPPPADKAVELSAFVVNTSRDVGYVAENTLAGSRLNTKLRDTASSVSVFTKEFLDDAMITDIRELVEYSVNGEMDTNSQGASSEQNRIVGGHALTSGIQIRGLIASFGMDYFTSITPSDPYRVGRYEDSRGPNSILFGIGSPGGLLNQSSKVAETHRHSGAIRYGTGAFARSRLEFDGNRVLMKDKLAVSVAALHQESGGWRMFDFQDKDRVFASVVYRPRRTLTFTAMGEKGRDTNAVIRSFPDVEMALAWYDNRNARGVDAVSFAPNNTVPTAAMQALGVTNRAVAATGNNRALTYIENDRSLFDARGTFLTGSYNLNTVRAPDGTPGRTTSALRINDPTLYPKNGNATGPGMFRDQTLKNYTLSVDWQATRNLILNLGHNYQETNAVVNLMNGNAPILRGEPNRALGVGGPANPYVGRLYFDGTWTRDIHYGESKETRLSASYNLETKSTWFGTHRIAGALSRAKVWDQRANSWLVLAGAPFNAVPSNANNRLAVRHYVTEGEPGTFRAGDWRALPSSVTFGGRSYDLAYANVESGGADNGGMRQSLDSLLGAVQSFWWRGRLVTTVGYRLDDVENIQLGYRADSIRGDVVTRDLSQGVVNDFTGETRTAGLVFHATRWLSFIANRSSNVGIPPLARTVFPEGKLAPLSKGDGEDYGLGFDLLDGRLNARVVYFKGSEIGRVTAPVANLLRDRNIRVMDAFGGVLAGVGRPFTATQWSELRARYTPPVSSISSDFFAEGYEARVTANFTRNWRLVANYSYTDSGRENLAPEALAWYGLRANGPVLLQSGVTQNAQGEFVVNPGAFEANGTVAKWIELGQMAPGANLSTLQTASGVTVAQEVFDLVDTLNDEREAQLKRWGVRPHKVSLFTAYDFRGGRLEGLTVGGGWRWRSPNVIGSNSRGEEIRGRVITATDVMVGYTWKPKGLTGRFRFQVNVNNVLDQSDFIPSRLAISESTPDGFMIPGGRGVAYSRYDLVPPREWRLTTTYSF